MQDLKKTIDEGFREPRKPVSRFRPAQIREAVSEVIAGLDAGTLRVAEKSTTPGSPTNGSRRRC